MTNETMQKPMIYVPAPTHPNNAQYRLTLTTDLFERDGEEYGTKTVNSQLIYNGDVPVIGRPTFPDNTYDALANDLGAQLLMQGKYGQSSPYKRDVLVVKHVPTPIDMERVLEEAESEVEDLSIRLYEVPGSGLSPIAETDWLETIPLEDDEHENLYGFVFRMKMSPAKP